MKITVKKSEKAKREQRIKDRKTDKKTNPNNREIMDYLNDLADRQSEIYDLLKGKSSY